MLGALVQATLKAVVDIEIAVGLRFRIIECDFVRAIELQATESG